MLDRYDNFVGERYRRDDERRYAESHRLAKNSGLTVSTYRRMMCQTLIRAGEQLVELGQKLQPPAEASQRRLMANLE